jgi:hypothetical protein
MTNLDCSDHPQLAFTSFCSLPSSDALGWELVIGPVLEGRRRFVVIKS